MYYVIEENTIIKGKRETLLKFYKKVQKLPSDYEDGKYTIEGDKLVLNPDFEVQQEVKERERLDMLFLTAADVERAIYKACGLDFDDILNLLKDNPQIDLKALKIEFKANNFYRGNPYIKQIGELLGYSSDELDYLFENKKLPIKQDIEEIEPIEDEEL